MPTTRAQNVQRIKEARERSVARSISLRLQDPPLLAETEPHLAVATWTVEASGPSVPHRHLRSSHGHEDPFSDQFAIGHQVVHGSEQGDGCNGWHQSLEVGRCKDDAESV